MRTILKPTIFVGCVLVGVLTLGSGAAVAGAHFMSSAATVDNAARWSSVGTRPDSVTATSTTPSRLTQAQRTRASTVAGTIRRQRTRRTSTATCPTVGRSSRRTDAVRASLTAGPIGPGSFSCPGRAAARARGRLVHQHRADRHHERSGRQPRQSIANVLRGLNNQPSWARAVPFGTARAAIRSTPTGLSCDKYAGVFGQDACWWVECVFISCWRIAAADVGCAGRAFQCRAFRRCRCRARR